MKYVAFICFVLSLSFKSIGQDTSDEDVDEHPCIHYNTSIQELRKLKRYRDVYKIYLVSFSANEDDIGQMPLKDGSADLTQMFEAILLNDSQRDSLLLFTP